MEEEEEEPSLIWTFQAAFLHAETISGLLSASLEMSRPSGRARITVMAIEKQAIENHISGVPRACRVRLASHAAGLGGYMVITTEHEDQPVISWDYPGALCATSNMPVASHASIACPYKDSFPLLSSSPSLFTPGTAQSSG
jgi:hypothetical protein